MLPEKFNMFGEGDDLVALDTNVADLWKEFYNESYEAYDAANYTWNFNVSVKNQPDCKDTLSVPGAVFMCLGWIFGLLTVLGNCIACYSFCKAKGKLNSCDIFLLCMCLNSVLSILCLFIHFLIKVISAFGSTVVCEIVLFLENIQITLMSCLVAGIALVRVFLILWPHKGWPKCKMFAWTVVIVGILLGSIPACMNAGRSTYVWQQKSNVGGCYDFTPEALDERAARRSVSLMCEFIVPLLILLICLLITWCKIRKVRFRGKTSVNCKAATSVILFVVCGIHVPLARCLETMVTIYSWMWIRCIYATIDAYLSWAYVFLLLYNCFIPLIYIFTNIHHRQRVFLIVNKWLSSSSD